MSSTALNGPARSSAERPVPFAGRLRGILREGTRGPHEALDRRFEGMMEAQTPDLFHRFIAMNEACHAALEPILANSSLGRAMPETLAARLGPALTRDREAMRLAPAGTPAFPLPLPDAAQAAGILYVLEGSRLGARYLHRAWRESGAAERWAIPTSHYLAGAAAGDFRALAEELDGYAASPAEQARALDAAQITFAFFAQTLDRLEADAPGFVDARRRAARAS